MMPMTGKGEKTMNRYGIVRRGNGNRNMIERPFRTFGDFMDSLFDVTSFWDDFGSFGRGVRQGQMNRIALKKDGVVVGYRYEHALPGFTKDDIDITLDKGVMTVHASKKSGNEPNENEDYEQCGISYSDVSSSYTLPENADADSIDCKFENGILVITVGLKQEQKGDVKKIQVR